MKNASALVIKGTPALPKMEPVQDLVHFSRPEPALPILMLFLLRMGVAPGIPQTGRGMEGLSMLPCNLEEDMEPLGGRGENESFIEAQIETQSPFIPIRKIVSIAIYNPYTTAKPSASSTLHLDISRSLS